MKKNKTFLILIVIIYCCISCSKTETEIVYNKVEMIRLTIDECPIYYGANGWWDGGNANNIQGFADVYFKITYSGTTNNLYILDYNQRLENLQYSNLPKSWATLDGSSFFTISNLNQKIDIDLYDYDYEPTKSGDYMGTTSFNFIDYTTGTSKYPTKVTTSKTTTNGLVKITLDLKWSN